MIEYAIIIKSKTRLESLIQRYNTEAQARFYIESTGGDFDDYVAEHKAFYISLEEVQRRLSNELKYKLVDRDYVSSYIFSENQLIIAVGQDGLVANVAKYSNRVPIIGVNPDPSRYDGVLLPFDSESCIKAVRQAKSQRCEVDRIHLAEARLNDGQRLLAFNDLFIGAASHVSARYKIRYNSEEELQSSSGVIVSTKSGSTGWMSSVMNMARGVAAACGNSTRIKTPRFRDDQLMFAVREPFGSIRTQVGICAGLLDQRRGLTLESMMPSGGVIFSDGIERDFVRFNSGAKVTIGIADEEAFLVKGI